MTQDLRKDPVVALANRVVSFPQAARLAGMQDVPSPRETGSRAFCPFGEVAHPDGGRDKALRVYSDHGFCFSEWLFLTPVRLFSMMHELPAEDAARQLLDLAGYRPASWQKRWDLLVNEKQEPDYGALAGALKLRLEARYAGWRNRQYDSVVSTALAECLGLLTLVHSDQDCIYWLEASSECMARVLGG